MCAIELYWSWIIDNCKRAKFKDIEYSESQLTFFGFIDEVCNETCRRMNEIRVIPNTKVNIYIYILHILYIV